jgi:hypothetical protein
MGMRSRYGLSGTALPGVLVRSLKALTLLSTFCPFHEPQCKDWSMFNQKNSKKQRQCLETINIWRAWALNA